MSNPAIDAFVRREFKSYRLLQGKANLEKRIISGYASTGHEDHVKDIVDPGAFLKTIEQKGPKFDTKGGFLGSKIKTFYNHRNIIGHPRKMEEDVVDGMNVLYTESYVDEIPLGDQILTQVKSGTIDSMSFSYDTINARFEGKNRHLMELNVHEYGPVDIPCNDMARILGVGAVKALHDELQRFDPDILQALKDGRLVTPGDFKLLKQAVEALTALWDACKTKDPNSGAGCDPNEDDEEPDSDADDEDKGKVKAPVEPLYGPVEQKLYGMLIEMKVKAREQGKEKE